MKDDCESVNTRWRLEPLAAPELHAKQDKLFEELGSDMHCQSSWDDFLCCQSVSQGRHKQRRGRPEKQSHEMSCGSSNQGRFMSHVSPCSVGHSEATTKDGQCTVAKTLRFQQSAH